MAVRILFTLTPTYFSVSIICGGETNEKIQSNNFLPYTDSVIVYDNLC